MSSYLDEKDLFMTPQVTQHGNHMVMTNVQKPIRLQYLNLDTRFKDNFQPSNLINYNITLPERVNEVKTITISNIELPMTFYNISDNLGNNTFGIIVNNKQSVIVIPNGQYDISGIVIAINSQISVAGISNMQFSVQNNFSIFSLTGPTNPITIDFSINTNGASDLSNLNFKLGGVLGFQYSQYILSISPLISAGFINLRGPRYLYVILDEFSGKGNQSTFSTLLQKSSLGKNILARIQIDGITYPYGTTLIANRGGGLLTSNIRSYNGKIDIQRFNIQLVNELGTVIDLNGQDLTLCLIVEYE